MARKLQDAKKERRWRDVLARFARSGLGVRAFCRREELTESAFYFWRRELARRDDEHASGRRSRQAARLSDFLPVHVTDPLPRQASITLELAGGRVLRLPDAMSIKHVAELVLAIEAIGALAGRSEGEVRQ
jgi:hypothetical protein